MGKLREKTSSSPMDTNGLENLQNVFFKKIFFPCWLEGSGQEILEREREELFWGNYLFASFSTLTS
jgi:hypothetical protein